MRTSALFRARLSFQKTVVTRYRIRAKSFYGMAARPPCLSVDKIRETSFPRLNLTLT